MKLFRWIRLDVPTSLEAGEAEKRLKKATKRPKTAAISSSKDSKCCAIKMLMILDKISWDG